MLLEKIKKIQKNVEEISVEKSKTLKNIIEELYMQNNLKQLDKELKVLYDFQSKELEFINLEKKCYGKDKNLTLYEFCILSQKFPYI